MVASQIARRSSVLALLTGACLPCAAHAGWAPPVGVARISDATAVAGSTPGQVSVVGIGEDGSVVAATHAPGGAWSTRVVVPADGTAEDGVTGVGGAFAVRVNAATIAIGRIRDDGSLARGTVNLATTGQSPVAVSAGADGSLLLLAKNEQDALRAYTVGPAAAAPALAGVLAPGAAGEAAATAVSGADFQAVWTEQPDAGAQRVRARAVRGTSLPGATLTLGETADDESSVFDPHAEVSGGNALAAWTQTDAATGATFARARSITGFSATRPPIALAGLAAVSGISLVAGPAGTFLLTYSGDGSGPQSAGAAILRGDGTTQCAAPNGFALAAGAARGAGYVVLGGTGTTAFALSGVGLDGACAAGTAEPGPDVGAADELAAGADAEGTVPVAATQDEGTTLTAFDATPPAILRLVVPATVRRGEAVDVSVEAADAWGVGPIGWTVDGAPAGSGASLRLPELSEGEHRVGVEVLDAAANRATATATLLVAPATQQPAATPTPTPTPTATPVATPVVTPVEVPVAAPTPAQIAPRARVVSARVERRAGGWYLRVRTRDADRVRLSLFRSPYLSGAALARRSISPSCSPPPAEHPEGGAKGRGIRRVDGETVRLRLPVNFQQALRRRGRYALRVVAVGPGGRSSAITRRWTVC